MLKLRSYLVQRFLQRFIDPTAKEDENIGLDLNEPLYMQRLEEVYFCSIVNLAYMLIISILILTCDLTCR